MAFTVKKMGAVSMTAAALLVASWGAQAADSSPTAVVHITATVTGSTCTPEWSDSQNIEVDMGRVADTALKSTGDVGATKPFTLFLKECDPAIKKVAVTALGQADSADSQAFANTAPASVAAEGVAVTLYGGDGQKTRLTPDGNQSAEYTVADGSAEMTFLATLVRSADAANAGNGEESSPKAGQTDGKVESTATLYMTYQ